MAVTTTKNDQASGVFDAKMIRSGFNFGLGTATAAVLVGMAAGAFKTAWVWWSTSQCLTVAVAGGTAIGGPVGGAVAGGACIITSAII